MFTLENESLKITMAARGAELQSIYCKTNGMEYMWNGDPAFWGKHSPVLFPIVGTLKEDTYHYEGRAYHMTRHGFAREMDFEVTTQTPTSIHFTLNRNDATPINFPFRFHFNIIYHLEGTRLSVTYQVINTGDTTMYFSVGGHPAFKVPLAGGTEYGDHYLEFNEAEKAGRWLISKEGLIETRSAPLLNNTRTLPLTKELFYKDAIVLKGLKSTRVKLLSHTSSAGLEMDFTGFPFLGIWAAKNADFVCIEPWCGIADSTRSNQQLTEKEGINALDAAQIFERVWSVGVLSGPGFL